MRSRFLQPFEGQDLPINCWPHEVHVVSYQNYLICYAFIDSRLTENVSLVEDKMLISKIKKAELTNNLNLADFVLSYVLKYFILNISGNLLFFQFFRDNNISTNSGTYYYN